MTIDLDKQFPHDMICGAARCTSEEGGRCDCDRDTRIAAHIERLEGALRTIREASWSVSVTESCAWCGAYPVGTDPHGEACPVPGIEALMAELGDRK